MGTMQAMQVAKELKMAVESAAIRFSSVTEDQASRTTAVGRWSAKQVLGHLIDSAANNHQRFVRMQGVRNLSLPNYEQEQWVAAGRYQESRWSELVQLWTLYNCQLARMVDAIPEAARDHTISIGDKPPVTLAYVAEDYVRHMRHHLDQIDALIKS